MEETKYGRRTREARARISRANLDKARAKRRELAKEKRERRARVEAEVKSALGTGKTLRHGVINIKDMMVGAVVDLGGREMIVRWAKADELATITDRKRRGIYAKYPKGSRGHNAAYKAALVKLDEGLRKEQDRRAGILITGVIARMLPSAQVIERANVETADAKDLLAEVQRLGQLVAVKTVGKVAGDDVG